MAQPVQGAKNCTGAGSEAVAATKTLIAEVRGKDPKDVRTFTVEKLANAWESESVKEGIESFFSKRKPLWDRIL